MSAIDQIYEKLTEVFGGNDRMQFFTLMMPGMVLEPETYAYDVAGDKPVRVAEAESRLVNQLYDVSQITIGSNGRHLASQYLQALGKLVPRFEPRMARVKTALRAYLAEPCTAVLDDGRAFSGSRQELYFTLYDAWARRKQAWEQKQADEREGLEKRFPGDPAAALTAYDEWFETVADAELMLVDAAAARVVGVLSPADMDAILGVLEAGTGGEIEEARRMVSDVRLRSRTGGYVYPVELRPANWFDALLSDADPDDLLDAPEYLATKLSARRDALRATISQVQSLLAGATGDVTALSQKLSDAQAAYGSAQTGLLTTYTENLASAASIYIAKKQKKGDAPDPTKADLDGLAGKVDGANPPAKAASFDEKDVQLIAKGQETLISSQSAYVDAAQQLVAAAQKLASAQATTYGGLQPYLARLQQQAADLDTLWDQLGISAARSQPAPTPPATMDDKGNAIPAPAPVAKRSAGSDRFLDLTFYFETTDMTDSSSLQTSASQTSWSVSVFLGSASGSSSSSSSNSVHDMLDKGTAIEIGLKAMRVDVDREWFDPGVFALTRDLESVNATPIARAPLSDWSKDLAEQNDAILPCYPVSFLVAKDITLKFKADAQQLHAARSVADSQSAVGGGFLCFSASHSESSHSESQSVSTSSESSVISIHIRSPQVIGWFMEFAPEDHSTAAADDTLSILEYLRQIELAPPTPSPVLPAGKVPVPALVGAPG